jgi:hypothetical protein
VNAAAPGDLIFVAIGTSSATESISCPTNTTGLVTIASGVANAFAYAFAVAAGTVTCSAANTSLDWVEIVADYTAPTAIAGCPPYSYPCFFNAALRSAYPQYWAA